MEVTFELSELYELVYTAAGAATAPLLEDHPTYEFPSERVAENVKSVIDDWFVPQGYPSRGEAEEILRDEIQALKEAEEDPGGSSG